MMRGGNCVNYSGTTTYTFRNDESFPVTIAFRRSVAIPTPAGKSSLAIPGFRYSSTITWQEQPFPTTSDPFPNLRGSNATS